MPENPTGIAAAPPPDPELEAVRQELLSLDRDGARIGHVLRDTIDQLLDGVHTGRYLWDDLYKTEKTHAGTLVEINLHREFDFDDGKDCDYLIAGLEVDCKFSQNLGGWMIPPEAMGHLCLVVWASDEKFKWSAGLIRVRNEFLSTGKGNRDEKRRLNKAGQVMITWLFKDHPLPPNVFLQLPRDKVAEILDPDISGQEGVNRLFKHAQGRIIGRAAVATAAQQHDFMKRVRGNGGAREKLRREGIVLLGHEHQKIARDLDLKVVPQKGEFVSLRLVRVPPNTTRATALIAGKRWAVARQEEASTLAPLLPRAKRQRSSKS